MIPYGRQDITSEDVEAVVAVLRSDFLTQGPVVPQFEALVAKHVGAEFAVAVNSATSALHIACLALGLGQGDWLWTSPITFVASANCGLYCGAQVDFVDIDPVTYNLCPQALEDKLIVAQKQGRLPKVVVPVHFAGQSCDMEAIYALGQKYGFRIIEDASHAVGGAFKEIPVGACRYSDITVFSFHPVKIITTGEGGMAVTNDAQLAKRMDLHRTHGVTRDHDLMTHESDGAWYYQQVELGFNYRMTDIQAALGISQIERLSSFVTRRNELAERYRSKLGDLPVTLPQIAANVYSAFHLFVVLIEPEDLKVSRREVFEYLRTKGVLVNVHYIPVHTQPYYQKLGFEAGAFPNAEKYYEQTLSIPLYPNLSERDQDYVVEGLERALAL